MNLKDIEKEIDIQERYIDSQKEILNKLYENKNSLLKSSSLNEYVEHTRGKPERRRESSFDNYFSSNIR